MASGVAPQASSGPSRSLQDFMAQLGDTANYASCSDESSNESSVLAREAEALLALPLPCTGPRHQGKAEVHYMLPTPAAHKRSSLAQATSTQAPYETPVAMHHQQSSHQALSIYQHYYSNQHFQQEHFQQGGCYGFSPPSAQPLPPSIDPWAPPAVSLPAHAPEAVAGTHDPLLLPEQQWQQQQRSHVAPASEPSRYPAPLPRTLSRTGASGGSSATGLGLGVSLGGVSKVSAAHTSSAAPGSTITGKTRGRTLSGVLQPFSFVKGPSRADGGLTLEQLNANIDALESPPSLMPVPPLTHGLGGTAGLSKCDMGVTYGTTYSLGLQGYNYLTNSEMAQPSMGGALQAPQTGAPVYYQLPPAWAACGSIQHAVTGELLLGGGLRVLHQRSNGQQRYATATGGTAASKPHRR